MEEIQIGNFIRDKEGNITEIISMINLDKGVYLYLGKDGYQYSDNCIVKHSKNIIDLIEAGDIVNNRLVLQVDYKNICLLIPLSDTKANTNIMWYGYEEIKTILTHEQYEKNCYKIGD